MGHQPLPATNGCPSCRTQPIVGRRIGTGSYYASVDAVSLMTKPTLAYRRRPRIFQSLEKAMAAGILARALLDTSVHEKRRA